MKPELDWLIKKYETYVSNIEWHIKNNEPTAADELYHNRRIDDFKEVIADLNKLPDESLPGSAGMREAEKEIKTQWIEQEFKELNVYLTDIYYQHVHDVKDAGHTWIEFTDKFNTFKRKLIDEAAPTSADKGLREETLRQVAWKAWKGAANAYRMYPDNKHTFTEYWGAAKNQFNEFLVEFVPPARQALSSTGGEKWVNRKEQRPPEGLDADSDVLVYGCKFGDLTKNTAGHCMIASWNGKFYEDGNGKDIEDNPDYWFITHWQPLPPSPSKPQQK